MIMLTVREWLGPGKKLLGTPEYDQTPVRERLVAFASHLDLGKAIEALRAYESAYNDLYRLAVNFFVIGVAKIDTLTDEQLDAARIELIEYLEIK